MNKYTLIAIVVFLVCSNVNAQYSPSISFNNEMEKIEFSQKTYSLLIRGESEGLLNFINDNRIILKYIHKEWIAITISGKHIEALIKEPALEEVFWNNTPGVVLNDQMLSNANVIGLQEIGIYDSLLNGENVILGFVDAGVDYSHPDFINEDNSSRILYIWDQNMPEDSSEIFEDYGYGKLITQDTLNAWIETETQYPFDPNAY